jgi:predicted ATPase
LSKQTRELCDLEVTDLGEHRLKDFADPVWIYQLGTEPFPPLKTISNTNLPRPASSFVGREQEIKEITAYLQNGARILTMTGPGGTGKTRLSVEAAATVVPDFRNGVFWVPLAPLRDPALVPITIGQTIGAKGDVAEYIGDKQMLLLLDNFEQVIEAAADLSPVVEACPNLRLLVTSRELLRLSGEVEYPVPPLESNDAVELFCRRSGRDPDAAARALCVRLDNLPLAVELAAGRANVLSPEKILDRLGRRLDLLKGGRDTDPRQATLRATIEWSHNLLDDDEKTLFARLAVFRGGWTLEAAEKVVDADIDVLQSLVEKSLVRQRDDRFVMLETIREFAAERLDVSDECDGFHDRHGRYFLRLAEIADRQIRGNPKEQLDLLERDLDNFRGALDYFERLDDVDALLRVAAGLWRLWYQRGPIVEGRRRIESALATDAGHTASRVRALVGAAALALANGDAENGLQRAEEAVETARELDDPELLAHALAMKGGALTDLDDFEKAEPLFEECRLRFRTLGDDHYEGIATMNLAYSRRELGKHDEAWRVAEAGLEVARRTGNRGNEAALLAELAIQSLDHRDRPEDAIALLKQSLPIWAEQRDMFSIGRELYRAGRAHASARHPEVGTKLLAAGAKLYEDMNAGEAWFWEWVDKTRGMLLDQIDEDSFDALWEEGRRLTVDDAVALALEDI